MNGGYCPLTLILGSAPAAPRLYSALSVNSCLRPWSVLPSSELGSCLERRLQGGTITKSNQKNIQKPSICKKSKNLRLMGVVKFVVSIAQ